MVLRLQKSYSRFAVAAAVVSKESLDLSMATEIHFLQYSKCFCHQVVSLAMKFLEFEFSFKRLMWSQVEGYFGKKLSMQYLS